MRVGGGGGGGGEEMHVQMKTIFNLFRLPKKSTGPLIVEHQSTQNF